MHPLTILAHSPTLTSPGRFHALMEACGDAERALDATPDLLKQRLGWKTATRDAFLAWRKNVDPQALQSTLDRHEIQTITIEDDAYPDLLKAIPDQPYVLFVRGTLPRTDQEHLAVVGSRRCSHYGRQVTHDLVQPIARRDVCIVSGLARGIDGIAHQSTLDVNGTTIAVLGTGCDDRQIYPNQHRQLAKDIISRGGAVISEYPPGTEPTRYTFPARNRIIAGLSHGTLVIEAGEKSGSLITARLALDYNRDVFAVPHPITSNTGIGTNNLLKLGATPVTSADDIIAYYNIASTQNTRSSKPTSGDTPIENTILKTLSREPTHVDTIIKNTQLVDHEVTSTLTLLEMKGYVRHLGGMMYVTHA